MARFFDDVSEQSLYVGSTPITAYPFTMACWFNSDVIDLSQYLFSVGDLDVADEFVALRLAGSVGGDPLRFLRVSAETPYNCDTISGYSASTWHHACAVGYAIDSVACLIDGGGKGTNVDSCPAVGWDGVAIGTSADSTPSTWMSGAAAGAALWNAALSEAEIAALASGMKPSQIRPQNLVAYWPLIQGKTWDRDIAGRGGFHMTPTNGPTWAPDPPQSQKYWLASDYQKRLREAEPAAPVVGGRRASPVLKPRLQQRLVREFDDGASQYLGYGAAVVTGPPFTMACWVKSDDIVQAQVPFSIASEDDNLLHGYWLNLRGNEGGDPVQFRSYDGLSGIAEATLGYSANTWHHLCGIEYASDSRACLVNGGNKGTDATSVSPASLDNTVIGAQYSWTGSSNDILGPMSGLVAGAAVWNAALSDSEVAAHAAGVSPFKIRPGNLVACWPLVYGESWDRDVVGGFHMTAVNAPTWAVGPQKIPMELPFWSILAPEEAAAGAIYGERGAMRGVYRGAYRGV